MHSSAGGAAALCIATTNAVQDRDETTILLRNSFRVFLAKVLTSDQICHRDPVISSILPPDLLPRKCQLGDPATSQLSRFLLRVPIGPRNRTPPHAGTQHLHLSSLLPSSSLLADLSGWLVVLCSLRRLFGLLSPPSPATRLFSSPSPIPFIYPSRSFLPPPVSTAGIGGLSTIGAACS